MSRGGVYAVTGGSRGIGRELVKKLCERGERVLAVGRDLETLRALHDATGADVLSADLATAAGSNAIVDRVRAYDEPLMGLIHNAGMVRTGRLAETGLEDIEAQLALNLRAPLELTRALVPHLSNGSTVIAVSSTLASRPAEGRAVYAATKSGLEAFARCMALELGPLGVRVNALAPGVVDTDMIRDSLSGDSTEGLEMLRGLHPLGRLGRTDDIWLGVEYLLDAGFVTGTVLTIDGGLTLG